MTGRARAHLWLSLSAATMVACSDKGPPPAEPTPQKPGWETPTPEACEAALARMRAVMPDSLDPDPATDRADCMSLPSALVACLATIQTPDDAEACVDKAAASRPRAATP
jgi:hypothetical protein